MSAPPKQPVTASPETARANEQTLAARERELNAAHDELERVQREIAAKQQEVERRTEALAQREIQLLINQERAPDSGDAVEATSNDSGAPVLVSEPDAASAADVGILLQQIDALNERSTALKSENASLRDEVAKMRGALSAEVDAAGRVFEIEPTQAAIQKPEKASLLLLLREIRKDPLHLAMAVSVVALVGGLGYLAGGHGRPDHVQSAPPPRVEAPVEKPAVRTPVAPEVPAPLPERARAGDGTGGGRGVGSPASAEAEEVAVLDKPAGKGPEARGGRRAGKLSARIAEVSADVRSRSHDLARCLEPAGARTHQVHLGFSVTATGQTGNPNVRRSGAAASPEVAACIYRVVGGWRFSAGEAVNVPPMTLEVRVP